jgi:long-chain acyl-CoA synthetase
MYWMNSSSNINKPWIASYPPDVSWEFEAQQRSVYDIFEKPALTHPDKPCIDFLNKKFSYGDIHDLVRRFACGLQQAGIKKGDRVGLCLPNSPYYVIAFFAAQKIGAVVVNFNVLYTSEEIEAQILDSEVETMVTLDLKAIYNKVAAALPNTMLERIVICPLAEVLPPTKKYLLKYLSFYRIAHIPHDKYNISFDDLISVGADSTGVSVDPGTDIALFQYTGGTTGIPKAAMLTHSNVVSNAEQVTIWTRASNRLTDQDRFLAVLPFFHVFSMTVMMCMGLRCGAELILLPRFKLKQALQTITEKKVTVMAGVPAIFNAINEYDKLDHYDLSSLSISISGGAALPTSVRDKFMANTQCHMVEGYGLSETSPVITCNPPHSDGKAASIGLPLPGTEVVIRSLEDSGILMPVGEKGELLARGPQVMQGYWKRDEESREVLSADGWLSTGDIAYMDDEGFLFLTDRLKDVIITNGYKVYPRVIEDALYQHPAVAEVIVIAIPDAAKGEVGKAFVVLKKDQKITAKKLLDFVADKLNPIECPKDIEIRDELPKTLIGKPSRKALAEEEAAK